MDHLSELKRLTEALQQGNADIDGILPTLPDLLGVAIIIVDTDMMIRYVNPSLMQLFGYTSTELIGQSLSVLVPPELRERHIAGFTRYQATKVKTMAWSGLRMPGLCKDLSLVELDMSFAEVASREGTYLVGIMSRVPA